MRKSHWRIISAAIVCGIGLSLAVIAFVRLGGRDTVAVAHHDQDGNIRIDGMDAARADEIIDRAKTAVLARSAELSLPDTEALADDVGVILQAWLVGTGDDYLAYLAASGDDPPDAPVWSDPDRRNKAWLDATRELRASSFDPDRLNIRASVVDGVAKTDQLALNRVTGWRFDKLSGVDDAYLSATQVQAAQMNIQEVRIPMHSKGILKDTEFDGLLVLSYARDPRTSQWTLIAVSVYDVPQGDTARTPPF